MLANSIIKKTEGKMWSPEFKQCLDDHLELLVRENKVKVITVTQADLNNSMGDLCYVMSKCGVSLDYLWAVMRLNNFEKVNCIEMTTTSILIPDTQYIDDLYRSYLSKL